MFASAVRSRLGVSTLLSPARFGPRVLGSPVAARVAVRHLSAEARQKIDNVVKSNDLVLFMKGTPDMPQCGFSRAVCQVFEIQGVPREKIVSFNCLEDQELREGIKEYSTWPTIPQVYLKGEFIGGCDIMIELHQSGELENMLLDAKLVKEEPATDAKAA
ncbi:monothiol glutaredoxin grx5 [Microbotryomycetes sp. JL201]|nr:monothiol glutaredoxin grx5 [Microbotryomycetes sp. JL201]